MSELIYRHLQKSVTIGDESLKYFDTSGVISSDAYRRLPFSIRILLESAVRNCDNFQVSESDVAAIVNWEANQGAGVEVRFRPARVILQDRLPTHCAALFELTNHSTVSVGTDGMHRFWHASTIKCVDFCK